MSLPKVSQAPSVATIRDAQAISATDRAQGQPAPLPADAGATAATHPLPFDLPTVTVGIPYHCETNPRQLQQAIESILAQSHRPYEIHLIQDGPVAVELERMAAWYLERYAYMTHLVLPAQAGLHNALNTSILQCHSTYYARMDSDDISRPERLCRQLAVLEADSALDILGTMTIEFSDDPDEAGAFLKQVPLQREEIIRVFHYRNPMVHPSVVFRTSVFAKIGIYDSDFTLAEDYELWARALKARVGIANLPEPLLYFRRSGCVQRRRQWKAISSQVRAAYRLHTWSPRLNALKVAAIAARLLPVGVQQWVYVHFR